MKMEERSRARMQNDKVQRATIKTWYTKADSNKRKRLKRKPDIGYVFLRWKDMNIYVTVSPSRLCIHVLEDIFIYE